MICQNCGAYKKGFGVELQKGDKVQHTGFCSYSCYLEFWKDVPLFEPLKRFVKKTCKTNCKTI